MFGQFDGKVEADNEWEFVKRSFNPLDYPTDSDDHLQVTYNAGDGAYVLAVYLYRETQVRWGGLEFTIWRDSGEIEIPLMTVDNFITSEGTRLRLHGGEPLGWLSLIHISEPTRPY